MCVSSNGFHGHAGGLLIGLKCIMLHVGWRSTWPMMHCPMMAMQAREAGDFGAWCNLLPGSSARDGAVIAAASLIMKVCGCQLYNRCGLPLALFVHPLFERHVLPKRSARL